MQKYLPEIEKHDAVLIGIHGYTPPESKAWHEKLGITFTLATDENTLIMKAYEVYNKSIDSHHEALAKRFLGSPTIRINGVDIEPGLENHADFGMQCRVYRIDSKSTAVPSKQMIRAALQRVFAGLSASTVREDNMHASERFLPSVCC